MIALSIPEGSSNELTRMLKECTEIGKIVKLIFFLEKCEERLTYFSMNIEWIFMKNGWKVQAPLSFQS